MNFIWSLICFLKLSFLKISKSKNNTKQRNSDEFTVTWALANHCCTWLTAAESAGHFPLTLYPEQRTQLDKMLHRSSTTQVVCFSLHRKWAVFEQTNPGSVSVQDETSRNVKMVLVKRRLGSWGTCIRDADWVMARALGHGQAWLQSQRHWVLVWALPDPTSPTWIYSCSRNDCWKSYFLWKSKFFCNPLSPQILSHGRAST